MRLQFVNLKVKVPNLLVVLLGLLLNLFLLCLLALSELINDLIHLSDLILIGLIALRFLFLEQLIGFFALSLFALGESLHGFNLRVEASDLFALRLV